VARSGTFDVELQAFAMRLLIGQCRVELVPPELAVTSPATRGLNAV
jgi:hypothetical protein